MLCWSCQQRGNTWPTIPLSLGTHLFHQERHLCCRNRSGWLFFIQDMKWSISKSTWSDPPTAQHADNCQDIHSVPALWLILILSPSGLLATAAALVLPSKALSSPTFLPSLAIWQSVRDKWFWWICSLLLKKEMNFLVSSERNCSA